MRFFDWGRGPVPILWAMFIVGLLILSNSLGLILSQTYVIEGVPVDYRSTLVGEIRLPFIPFNGSDIELIAPEEVPYGEPFNVSFIFPENEIPHFRYDVIFDLEGEERSFGLYQLGCVFSTRIPMLNSTGRYLLSLRTDDRAGTQEIMDDNWNVTITPNVVVHPVPLLDEFLSPTMPDRMIFDTFDLDPDEISNFTLVINGNITASIENQGEGTWGVRTRGLFGPGWNHMEVGLGGPPFGEIAQIYYIQIGYDQSNGKWDLSGSVRRAFNGEDELFDQSEDDPFQELGRDEIELYIDALYSISLDLAFIEDLFIGLDSFEDGLPPTSFFSLRCGKRTYPLARSMDGDLTGYFFPPGTGDDGFILITLFQGNEEIVINWIDIVLKVDHSPHSRWDPDPFALETYENDFPLELELELLADWENFNRKDFTDEPAVEIAGRSKLPSGENEEFYEHSYSYILTREEAYSGNILKVNSSNSLEFGSWFTLLIPTPSLFLVFPVPLTGWAAVAWFVMISIACLASVMLLFYRQFRPLWKDRKRSRLTDRIKKLYSPDSELALTSKTYLGALFFFFMIYWMLGIFEQPTPGLSILSSETPIWIRMFLLADASVWEEISGRVVLIGLPLLVIRSISEKKGIQWKQLFGGSAQFGTAEIFLILMSATLFGLAHLGWGPWKVAPTFVHGLLFGYLFVKVGLHASIVMHFLFDYTGFVNEITGLYGPTWILVFFTTLLLGGLFLGDWVYRGQKWFAGAVFNRTPRPIFQLIAHSFLSIAFGIILLLKGGPYSISLLFFSIPLIDFSLYSLWKMNGSRISRIIVIIWAHFAWVAAPFGIAWAVRPEEKS